MSQVLNSDKNAILLPSISQTGKYEISEEKQYGRPPKSKLPVGVYLDEKN